MEQRLAAAVIGCGRMGSFTSDAVRRNAPSCWFPLNHAEAINSHRELSLNALCDVDAKNLSAAANLHQVDRCYKAIEELLDVEKPSLLGVATRTPERTEIIEIAVEKGVRSLHVEKPLCNNMGEYERLKKLFLRDDIFITWGAIRRFFPVYCKAIQLVESGFYGRLCEVKVNFGRGSLYWTHPHSIDLLLFAAAGREIAEVQARMKIPANERLNFPVTSDPELVAATIYFSDGLVGHVSQAGGMDFVLCCEHAEIIVRADGRELELFEFSGGPYMKKVPLPQPKNLGAGGILGAINHLVRCLRGCQENIFSNASLRGEILNSQLVAFAMLQSHIEGSRPIKLNSINPDMAILACSDGRYA